MEVFTDVHSLGSTLCMGVSGTPLVDGAAVIQSACQGATSQTWYLRPYGGQSQITLQASGQCLSATGGSTASGTAMIQTSCTSSSSGTWYIQALGSGYQIVSYASGLCLTVSNGSGNSGAAMVQTACGNSSNLSQLWGFSGAPKPMSILSEFSGKCLDTNGGILQYTCTTSSTQQWTLTPYKNGFRFIFPATGNCLGIDPNNAGDGKPFVQATCVSDSSLSDWGERWYLYVRGSTFELANGIGPWCLEMDASSDGSGFVQKSCNSNQNQLFAVRPFSTLTPDVAGQWGPVISLPIVPVAMATLATGKVLMWAANDPLDQSGSNPNATYTALFDPVAGTSTEKFIVSTNHNMFCPGISNLLDGRIFINGGASNNNTTIYNPFTDTWTADKLMNIGRGYEGDTMLPGGNVLTIGGSWPAGNGGKTGEIWDVNKGWTLLPGLPDGPVTGPDPQGPLTGDNHIWLFATGPSMVFNAGPTSEMHWLDTSGTGAVYSAGFRGDDAFSITGVAVMYGPGLIFKAGGAPAYGGANATNSTYLINILNSTAVTKITPMRYPRAFASGVVLPTGDILVSGGQTYAAQFTDTLPVMSPELWSVKTQTFTELAPEIVPRTYHSVALLLPDARVLIGGGGLCVNACSVNHPDVQIFTPPYLLNSDGSLKPRISILSAPTTAAHSSNIPVTTSGPASSFVMIRLSSITHTVNNDQRRIALTSTQTGTNKYSVAIPPGKASALAGYYMLFALDANGVPSVSSSLLIQP